MLPLFFLSLAFIGIIIYAWRKKPSRSSSNRYQRKPPTFNGGASGRTSPAAPVSQTELEITSQLYADVLSEEFDDVKIIKPVDNTNPQSDRRTEAHSIGPGARDPRETVELSQETHDEPKQQKDHQPAADHMVVLYLMAKEGETYNGYELLQALLSAGLRFGKHRIFHRHAHKDGRGEVLFSCASATEPGTFDLTKMGSFSSKGLCLFFTAASTKEPLATLDCLLETLDQLIDDLGGVVLDHKKALFTRDQMVMHRQKLRAIENNKTTADLFS